MIAHLERDAAAVTRYQDAATGLWYQVLDKARAKGNYLESSASCMFVYALAKGVRRGYLPAALSVPMPSAAIKAFSVASSRPARTTMCRSPER